jgi:hypothetical protein
MSTNFRAELQRLVQAYDEHGGRWPMHHEQALSDAVKAARASLDVPSETKWPTAVELTHLLYHKFTVSTGHGSSQDAIGFAYAVLAQWDTALPRISADGLQPSMDDVMDLAKAFKLEVNSPDALMWLVVTALASWGDAPALASAPDVNGESIDELRERTRRKYDRSGRPVPNTMWGSLPVESNG